MLGVVVSSRCALASAVAKVIRGFKAWLVAFPGLNDDVVGQHCCTIPRQIERPRAR